MIPVFLQKALSASIVFSMMAGPLGALMLWRRLPFVADTLAHAGVLGVSLGVMLSIAPVWGMALVSILVALLLTAQRSLTLDVRLAVLANGLFALGLVVMSALGRFRMDLLGLLFGDVLSVSWSEIYWMILMGVGVLFILHRYWDGLIAGLVAPDLARVRGVRVDFLERLLMIVVALVVAFASRWFGVLLVSGLLVIPAATARHLASSPEGMVRGGMVLGILSSVSGILLSFYWDLPTGPMVVLVASSIYLFVTLVQYKHIIENGG